MKRISTIIILTISFIVSSICQATPIVSVFKDELSLSAYAEVATLGGGISSLASMYEGPLLPYDKRTLVSRIVDEPPCTDAITTCGEEHHQAAISTAELFHSGVSLSSYSFFYWGSSLPGSVTWDGVTDPVQTAISKLSWVFSVSEDVSIRTYVSSASTEGHSSAVLIDKTDKEVLVNDSVTNYYHGITSEIFLLAGHKYLLNTFTTDFSLDDDTHGYADFYFSENVQFTTVPEPSSLILLGAGLAGLGFTRKQIIA